MTALQRHRLVRLTPAGWRAALAAAVADEQELLSLWQHADLPLVVARQDGCAAGLVRLGLPGPATHARRRVALAVAPAHLRDAAPFPAAGAVEALLPMEAQAEWRSFVARLEGARVFGSYGWQVLTGRPYVHARSDIDLLLPAAGPAAADAIVARLETAPAVLPRLDGELLFADGSAVAWREWLEWRAGRAGALLVKRIDGVRLVSDGGWLERLEVPA